jgi:hypothetical protein
LESEEGGAKIADIRKLEELTEENRHLKQICPEGIYTPI